jgi:hypothetical protein
MDDRGPRAAQAAVMALGLLVILRAAVRDWRALGWLAGLGGRPDQGLSALWGVAAANVGLVLLTQRPLGGNYLLPLYSVLPIWTGECLQWLWGWRTGQPQAPGQWLRVDLGRPEEVAPSGAAGRIRT